MKASILLLIVLFAAGGSRTNAAVISREFVPATHADKFLRTELFFGMSKPDGTQVSTQDWEKFVEEVIVPAFPDGFTVVLADGRFRGPDGRIISEKSRLLIILYPRRTRAESSRKLDAIRAAYLKLFDQRSVLRMDLPGPVNVSFE